MTPLPSTTDHDSVAVRAPILRDEIEQLKAQCAAIRRDVARAFRTPPSRPSWQEQAPPIVVPAEAPARRASALASIAVGWLAGLALGLAGAWIARGGFAP